MFFVRVFFFIRRYLSFLSLSFLYSFSIFSLSLVVFRVMLKCPGTPTSLAFDTLCTCWSTPIPRNSFNSSSSKSVPSSSSILAKCMVRNLAKCWPLFGCCCLCVLVFLLRFIEGRLNFCILYSWGSNIFEFQAGVFPYFPDYFFYSSYMVLLEGHWPHSFFPGCDSFEVRSVIKSLHHDVHHILHFILFLSVFGLY